MLKKLCNKYLLLLMITFNGTQPFFNHEQKFALVVTGLSAIGDIYYFSPSGSKMRAFLEKVYLPVSIIGGLVLHNIIHDCKVKGLDTQGKTIIYFIGALFATAYSVVSFQQNKYQKRITHIKQENFQLEQETRTIWLEVDELKIMLQHHDDSYTEILDAHQGLSQALKRLLHNNQQCVRCGSCVSDIHEIGIYKCGHWVCPCYKVDNEGTDMVTKCPHSECNCEGALIPLSLV